MATLLNPGRSVPSYLDMPLTEPSAEAALAFLQELLPAGVLSSGSGRRRRRDPVKLATGRRSDQGYLVFYNSVEPDAEPHLQALKSPTSIQRYLQQRIDGPLSEVWVATQITQHRSGRNGRRRGSFTAAGARHVLTIVVDLDGKRMGAGYRELLQSDWWGFRSIVENRLGDLGVQAYYLVRSGPEGAHLYIPLIRPDGRPLRASEKTLDAWTRAARGVARFFEDLGADPNAIRPTQPFAIPGIPRRKHAGFIPYVAARRSGQRANLWFLIRQLSELRLLPRTRPASVVPLPSPAGADVSMILQEIQEVAKGVQTGSRNQVAHDIAVYLLSKGATVGQTWDALLAWNERNHPPLSERELAKCLDSAQRCEHQSPREWAEMSQAPWNRLRGLLGLPAVQGQGYLREGRWRPLTPPKPWEQRKYGGGREHYEEVEERLLRFIAGEGGVVELTQAEICDIIDTNRSTLKVVLKRLVDAGRLDVITRRGRNGTSRLALLEEPAPQSTENGQSGNSTAAQVGVRVGTGCVEGAAPAAASVSSGVSALCGVGCCPDVVSLAGGLFRGRLGLGLPADVRWLVIWTGRDECQLIARGEKAVRFLRWFVDLGLMAELVERLGGIRVRVRLGDGVPFEGVSRSTGQGQQDPDGNGPLRGG